MKLHEKIRLFVSLCSQYNLASRCTGYYLYLGPLRKYIVYTSVYDLQDIESMDLCQIEELVLNHALEEMGNEY